MLHPSHSTQYTARSLPLHCPSLVSVPSLSPAAPCVVRIIGSWLFKPRCSPSRWFFRRVLCGESARQEHLDFWAGAGKRIHGITMAGPESEKPGKRGTGKSETSRPVVSHLRKSPQGCPFSDNSSRENASVWVLVAEGQLVVHDVAQRTSLADARLPIRKTDSIGAVVSKMLSRSDLPAATIWPLPRQGPANTQHVHGRKALANCRSPL